MPNPWDTFSDSDANLWTQATTEEDWQTLLDPLFTDEEGATTWSDFWGDHQGTFLNQFNYENTHGASEALAKRSYTKGLESYTNQMYGKIGSIGRARGKTGFAGSGTGLGLQQNQNNLWSDYQSGLVQRKHDLSSQVHGYAERFKGDVLNHINQLSAAGVFEAPDEG